jgi:hypothetical protein
VLILRWYWWRERVEELSQRPFVTSVVIWHLTSAAAIHGSYVAMLLTVGTTLRQRPTLHQTRIRCSAGRLSQMPRRTGLAPLKVFGADSIPGGALSWVNWVAGWLAIYAALFGVGQLLVGTALTGLVLLVVAAILFGVIARNLSNDASFRAGGVDTPASNV